jgi:hypothetical protein
VKGAAVFKVYGRRGLRPAKRRSVRSRRLRSASVCFDGQKFGQKRRRPELRRLGIVFVEDGNRSFYATETLVHRLPSKYQPQ